MLLDAENLFSDKQAITGTAVSDNVVHAPKNLGDGEPVFISVTAVEKLVGLTSLEIQLQTADVESGPFTTVQSAVVQGADLNSGTNLVNVGSVPPRTKKFVRLNYVVTGSVSAGKITAGLVLGRQTNGLE